ncbi:septum site-determining protein MinC [Pasteurellaceae bacterium HPA106]|uniref:septum site-determining protein MinC n=1 Tax=Spirabiliibacterium pneumoniae TaxID=221400 RepID=UPI001AADA7EF|nr:septum site-determining protein MinC [Spirabiliibacterium pneumoniae]MBE2896609.1 septum site-determining protein MinC [Spirabiliibacterium pneumoniae]
MQKNIIEFHTGQFSSIVLSIHATSMTAIKKALALKVEKSPLFFQNVPVILHYTPELEKCDLNRLKALLMAFGIQLIGVSNWQNKLQKELILSHDLPALGKSSSQEELISPRYIAPMVINSDINKNNSVYAKNRDLIIFGDVQPGAEVVSDGNIHVYGKLLGRAMAGLNNEHCALYTQFLDPEFIAVCQRHMTKPLIPIDYLLHSVRVSAEGQTLIFTAFDYN